jgi:F-type H+-transporting ATPase subunit b
MSARTTSKRSVRAALALALVAGSLGYGASALAQQGHDAHGSHAAPVDAHGAHGAPAAKHGDAGHGDGAAHGGGHHELGQINWVYGLISEGKEGEEPSLLFRPKGMPVPFLANVLNFGLLALALGYFGKKPMAEGLTKRKQDLMREIDEAAKVKAEAEARLADYQKQLDTLDDEALRIRAEYAEQGKLDHERIVREARERRERMKRDAEFLIEQEGKELRAQLLRKTVDDATAEATALLREKLSAQDQDRLAQEYLEQLGSMQLGDGGAA